MNKSDLREDGQSSLAAWLMCFMEAGAAERNEQKERLAAELQNANPGQPVVRLIAEALAGAPSGPLGEYGRAAALCDAVLTADLLELAYATLTSGEAADLESYVLPASRLIHLEKKERDKSDDERYVQYRAAVLVDGLLALNVGFSKEAAELLRYEYYVSGIPAKELNAQIWWRLAERGIDISDHIRTLHAYLNNQDTDTLAVNSLLALWAAVRRGFFDSPIRGSENTQEVGTSLGSKNTYQVWLWGLVTKCVGKLRRKGNEELRLGAAGCLLDLSSRYPQTQRLILECMENWGVKEPKRLSTDVQRDIAELYARCRNHPGTTCLPANYVITKKGIQQIAGSKTIQTSS